MQAERDVRPGDQLAVRLLVEHDRRRIGHNTVRMHDHEPVALSVGGEALEYVRCVEREYERLAVDAKLLRAELQRPVVVQGEHAPRLNSEKGVDRRARGQWRLVVQTRHRLLEFAALDDAPREEHVGY